MVNAWAKLRRLACVLVSWLAMKWFLLLRIVADRTSLFLPGLTLRMESAHRMQGITVLVKNHQFLILLTFWRVAERSKYLLHPLALHHLVGRLGIFIPCLLRLRLNLVAHL